MSLARLLRFGILLSCAVSAPAQADVLSVSSWSLATGVGSAGDGIGGLFEVVENPFSASQYFEYGPSAGSTAYTAYNFAWSDSGGDFLIQASHRAEDYDVRSSSNGFIRFTSIVDLLLTVEGSYTYDLPGGPMVVRVAVTAYDALTHDELFSQGFNDNTFLEGHAEGSVPLQGQALLPANREISFNYTMHIDTLGSTGLIGSGDGFVHFTLQPIPEPSALALLLLTALAVRRRPRQSQLF